MIISDFDKTLTDKDTLLGFYYQVILHKKMKILFIPIYYMVILLCKVGILSNTHLKRLGVGLFLKGLLINELDEIAKEYARRIELNQLALQLIASNRKVVVISASFEEYLKYVTPDHWCVYGSRMLIVKGKVSKLDRNLFGDAKGKFLRNIYTEKQFELFYTDSQTDKSVSFYAKRTIMV